jgi:hypothetical protein
MARVSETASGQASIRTVPLAELKGAPYNPRAISPEALAGLKASIARFGLVQPIVVNKRTGHVVGGHQRIRAMLETGEQEAMVVEVDLAPTEERALNLALNSRHIEGEWTDALGRLLDEVKLDLPGLFVDLRLGELLDDVPKSKVEAVEDEVPELPKVPVTKAGDLWTLGRHRLLCGDNADPGCLARVIADADIALVLTDPPYGIAIVKVPGGSIGGSKPVTIGRVGSSQPQPLGFLAGGPPREVAFNRKRGRVWQDRATPWPPITDGGKPITVAAGQYLPIAGDDRPYDPSPLLTLGREQIIFGAHNFAHSLPENRCWIVWDKENGDGSFGDAELAWASHDRAVKLYRHKWNGLVRAGSRAVEGVRRMHPTQKPVGLFGSILQDFSERGDVILDPFLGSGTTLIAAEQLSRRCFGLEIEPAYCDVIVERWQNLTGGKATRETVAA